MKLFRRTLGTILPLVACLCGGSLFAQDLADMTLCFDDLTTTNVNQTVAENGGGNEKEIEFGDYDNDGDIDVVIGIALSDFGQRRNKLYRNDNGVLNEVSGTSVIPGFSSTDVTRSVYFRDYNDDGLLDIIVICDSNAGSGSNNAPGKTKLYLQNASNEFVNESQDLNNVAGAACNGVSEDFDGNGLFDLMMCNYPNSSQDRLTLNGINGNSAGIFTDVTGTNFPVATRYGVHAEAADMNGDGLLDVLVANWTADPSFIYYNNNNGAGSGPGDFRYTDGGANTTYPAIGGTDERAMVPADFNNDGLMDMYFANHGGSAARSDVLYINTGNDANNRATFSTQEMPAAQNTETHKITCNDLDGDGKVDMIVMSNGNRPYIYRNTSAGGDVSFIEWTTPNITATVNGWMGNSADVTGNERPDVFFGANTNDHLFQNIPLVPTEFDSLVSGVLPAFHDLSPVAISGDLAGGDTETMIAVGLPLGSKVSILVRSAADVSLNATVNGVPVGSSSRSGDGVDEAIEFTVPSNGALFVDVTNESGGVLLGDINGDGNVNLLDVAPFVDLIANGQFNPAADFDGNGFVNLLDVNPFVDALTTGGGATTAPYVIEFLSRS